MSPKNPFLCTGRATPKQAFSSLQSLVYILHDLSSDDEIDLSSETTKKLKKSTEAINGVITFLKNQKTNFLKLKQICTSDKEYNLDSLNAIGDMMVDLAHLFKSLGDSRNGISLLGGRDFVIKTIVCKHNFKFTMLFDYILFFLE